MKNRLSTNSAANKKVSRDNALTNNQPALIRYTTGESFQTTPHGAIGSYFFEVVKKVGSYSMRGVFEEIR